MTLYDYLSKLAESTPDMKLLGEKDCWLTVRQVRQRVNGIAASLLAQGVHPGDLITVTTMQDMRTALTLFALNAIGAVAVLCDPRSDWHEQTADMHAVGCIDNGMLTTADGSHQRLLSFAQQDTDFVPASCADAPAFIIFTSGSTGRQKAVVLSANNLIQNMIEAYPLGGYRSGDIALGVLPMTHVFGLVLLVGALTVPYGLYLLADKHTDAMLNAIEQQGITRMNAVPSIYLAMAAQCAGRDLHLLRYGFIGGGPCTPAQFCHIEQALGMTLIPAYGMSECIGISSAAWQDAQGVRSQGVGRFYPNTNGRILRTDDTPATIGEIGEICVDSPTRMLGYWGEQEHTSLLHTGDLGYVDANGILHLTGRIKDVIIRNGVNLSAVHIEETLLGIPGVESAAVIGLPDSACGELPYAMVVGNVQEADLLSALSHSLHKNELPVAIRIVPQIPMTASGKPNKQIIREVLSAWAHR